MAFCNSCGATLDAGTKFCNKCGAAVVAPVAPVAPAAAGAPAKQGSSALKILLIVVAVMVGLGILGAGAVGFLAYKFAKSSRIEQKEGKVSIKSPILNMESSDDPEQIVRDLGLAVYPGARPVKQGSASVTIAGMNTVTAVLESDDPASQVADFYREQLPDANVSSGEGNHYTIVKANDKDKEWTTVNIQGNDDGKTHIQISRVRKGGA
jgi:hypothetical protein